MKHLQVITQNTVVAKTILALLIWYCIYLSSLNYALLIAIQFSFLLKLCIIFQLTGNLI